MGDMKQVTRHYRHYSITVGLHNISKIYRYRDIRMCNIHIDEDGLISIYAKFISHHFPIKQTIIVK